MCIYGLSMPLTRRLQILLPPERFADLQAEARRNGTSIGAVVREAIDARLGQDDEARRRREAGERLLGAEPVSIGDWADVKREIEEMHEPHEGA